MSLTEFTEEDAEMNFLPALISALIAVESGGVCSSIGDGGKALGCLQIHKSVVQDVNRIYKTHYSHGDAFHPTMAKQICELYLRAWAPENATPEQCARIWNGGPRGHLKEATKKYWLKVRKEFHRRGAENAEYVKLNGGNQ